MLSLYKYICILVPGKKRCARMYGINFDCHLTIHFLDCTGSQLIANETLFTWKGSSIYLWIFYNSNVIRIWSRYRICFSFRSTWCHPCLFCGSSKCKFLFFVWCLVILIFSFYMWNVLYFVLQFVCITSAEILGMIHPLDIVYCFRR